MATYTSISIASGLGMLDHAVNMATGMAIDTILYVERDIVAAENLAWQMEKGYLSTARIWSNVKTAGSEPVREYINQELAEKEKELDFLIGGIPCQPWSNAGKQLGSHDERDLWPATVELIKQYKPEYVFIENVAGILTRSQGGWRIKTGLEDLGYQVEAGIFSSLEAGANHQRERFFILGHYTCSEFKKRFKTSRSGQRLSGRSSSKLADSNGKRCEEAEVTRKIPNTGESSIFRRALSNAFSQQRNIRSNEKKISGKGLLSVANSSPGFWNRYAPARNDLAAWERIAELEPSKMPVVESSVRRVFDGMAGWAEQLHGIGNGVDPLVGAYAFVTLWSALQSVKRKGE